MAGTALREILARFGIEVDTKELDKGNKRVDDFSKKLENFGQVVAGAFVLTGVQRFVKGIFDEGNALYLASRRAGIAVEQYQGLEYATEMLNVSTQNLGVGIKYLHRNLALAANGNKQLKETFTKLGVSIQEGVPNDANEEFLRIADAIKNIKDENIQTAMSMKVFGRSGALLLPVMKAGSEQLKGYAAEVKALGGGFSNSMAEMVDSLDDQINRQKMALRSVRAAILDTIIPALKVMTDTVTAVAKGFMWLNQHGEAARVVIVTALLAITAACAPLIAALLSLALPLLGLVAIAMVLEDIYVWFRGGKSLIGEFFDIFDKRISESAKIAGDSFGMMSLSWSNFVFGMLTAWQSVGYLIGSAWNDLWIGFEVICAKLEDRWNQFIYEFTKNIGLPPWVNKLLRIGDYEADAASGKSHEQQTRDAGAQRQRDWTESFLNDPAVKNYQAAMQNMKQSEDLSAQNDKLLKLQQKYGGVPTDYNPTAGYRNTPGQQKFIADEKRKEQVASMSSKYGGSPADYWKNQAPASAGMVDALRKVAEGQDKVQARQAKTLLESGAPVTNAAAYKILAPEMLPEQMRPKGFVEQPYQSKFFNKQPEQGPVAGVVAPQQPSVPVAGATNNVTKNFTDNSTKTVNVQVGRDQKDQATKLAKDIANNGLRGKMDREFADPNFEMED